MYNKHTYVTPKDRQLGKNPNILFEPCTPIPLGIILLNGVECISGMFIFQDIVREKEL